MARVRVSAKSGALSKIAKSGALLAQLEPLATAVLNEASKDPNEAYVATLRKTSHISGGRVGRVSWRVGSAPWGTRIEALRGTLARALGRAR